MSFFIQVIISIVRNIPMPDFYQKYLVSLKKKTNKFVFCVYQLTGTKLLSKKHF